MMLLSHSSSTTTTTTTTWRLAAAAPPPARSRRARLLPPRARAADTTTGVSGAADRAAEALLQSGLRPESLPRHVAVVMDGNSRWARARGLTPADGHKAGGRNLERIVGLSRAWGIRALTAFVCSRENLSRPKAEVDYMMGLSEWLIGDNIDKLSRQGIRLQVIGDATQMPASLRSAAEQADEATRHNSQLHVMLAICYSGRWDMVQACRELVREAQAGRLSPDDVDESLVAGKLATSAAGHGEFSCPDLVVRTSGELRLSNFLLWQSAYSEFFFTDKMWPDFGEAEYLEALRSFQARDRRFGQSKLL
ncbi:uncharacterized protein LOC8061664 isoform X1 [Sorghum bicolor]|nr:uncharacterized protein LOC8061664 isoform X1 [Sorghum bicolor]|eukprot:XP_002461959.1 uncharacterized protein LOC8061664 isoform X1 [Sorghum bicolor]